MALSSIDRERPARPRDLERFCPKTASIVQNIAVMAFTKGPSGAVVASPGGRSAGRDSDPWYGAELGVAARLGPDQTRVLTMWHYKNFVQSGEWALTVIAPTGGVVAGAIVIVGSIVGVA